jgi:NitT/TauT family transport system substrate-binding protein
MSKSLKVILAVLGVILALGLVLYKYFGQPSVTRPLHLTLGFNTWVGYGPFYVADKKEFFTAEGLQVELQRIEGTAERRAALIAGRLDALGTTIDDVAVGAEQGVPAKVALAVDQSHGADGIVVSSDITDITQLRGRSVAVQPGFVSHFFLLYLLDQHGISPKDIRIEAMEPDVAGAAFVAGRIDAAVTWEPWLSKAKTRPGGTVLLTSADVPGIIVDVVTARDGFAEAHPRAVTGLIRAWFRAVDYLQAHPEESRAIIAQSFSLGQSEAGDMLSGVRYLTPSENEQFLNGSPSPAVRLLRKAGSLYTEAGLIKRQPDVDNLVAPQYLPAAAK